MLVGRKCKQHFKDGPDDLLPVPSISHLSRVSMISSNTIANHLLIIAPTQVRVKSSSIH